MEESPFPYQGPLEPGEVRGRDDLVADLVRRIAAHKVTALLGPRRYGKTSVLHRVAAELTEVHTIFVDLYEVTSMADVAVRFDEALAATTGRLGSLTRRYAVQVSLNLGALRVALSGPARSRPDPALVLHGLLDVIVKTAASSATLLVVDEFSSVARVEGVAGAMRTAFQHHYRDLGLIFAGSHPSMMRTLFTSRPQPFYGQADLVDIAPLSAAAVEEIVDRGFATTGRHSGRLAGLLVDFAAGHPQRTMQLADACWSHTQPGGSGDDAWPAGLAQVRRESSDGMERLFSGHNLSERRVLRSVAVSGSVHGHEAELLGLGKSPATSSRDSLRDAGELILHNGSLRIVDPVLADWIRQRFPL
ncbi:hypothetical protein K6U06_14820 [Acidiferrimicrobium sp. IK]|uniref:hypothetical protein n=1 Tax=Acidiferrimicrobium sp. IK TaxID=2871700 RepID=UPI0021CAF97A|nr:hypothetical protein [Acidiferrimicrobium sp. IK]MCU4185638.1 hypothetical protein [Acidiferrimicrobium sp. IK]